MAGSTFDFSKVVDNAIQVITKPVDFYRQMPKTGGYVEPMIFVAVMAVAAALIMMILSFLGTSMVGFMAMGMAGIIIIPIFAVIGSFIGAAIMFVIWKLLGSDQPFETAYRCVAYASAIYPITAVLNFIPYLGSIAGVAWGMYLMASAGTEAHGIDQKKAYIVFGVLGLLLIVVNVSSERTARQMQANMEQLGMDLQSKNPEELGKAIGEFMKGLEKSQKSE